MDEGVWKCNMESDFEKRQPSTRFLFVDIGGKDGPEILLKDNIVVDAKEGEEAALVCPTSIRPIGSNNRPTCIWFSPQGVKYDIIGRFAYNLH